MKRFPFSSISVCVAVLLLVAIAAAATLRAGENAKKIRIIYTNDMVGYIDPCG